MEFIFNLAWNEQVTEYKEIILIENWDKSINYMTCSMKLFKCDHFNYYLEIDWFDLNTNWQGSNKSWQLISKDNDRG